MQDARIASLTRQSFEGIPLLGSAVQSEFDSLLGVFGLALQPVRNRLNAAVQFVDKLEQLAAADLSGLCLQVAWCCSPRLGLRLARC